MHSERQQHDLESAEGRYSDVEAGNYELQEVMKGQRKLQPLATNGADKHEMPPNIAAADSTHLQGASNKLPTNNDPLEPATLKGDVEGAELAEIRGRMGRDRLFGLLKRVSSFATPTALAVLALVAYSYVVGHKHPATVTAALTMTFAVSLCLVVGNIFREDLFPENVPARQENLIKCIIILQFLLMAVCFVLFFIF